MFFTSSSENFDCNQPQKFGQCASAAVDTLVALQICSNGVKSFQFCRVGFEDVDNSLPNCEFKLAMNEGQFL